MKRQVFLILSLCLFAVNGLMAQNHVNAEVQMNDGGQFVSRIDQSGGLYFSGDTLTVVSCEGSADYVIPLDNVRTIVLYRPSNISSVDDASLSLYPNPTVSMLTLAGLGSGRHQVRVFSSIGRLVMETEVAEGAQIDVSDLSSGLYFLFSEGQLFKFIKK